MARKLKQIPQDPPHVLALRERLKPADFTQFVPNDPDFFQKWELHWVNKNDRWFRMQQVKFGFVPVKVDEGSAPNATGDMTTNLIHSGDLILCKCPKEEYEERRMVDREVAKSFLPGYYDEMRDTAEQMGVKDFELSLDATEEGFSDPDGEVPGQKEVVTPPRRR